MDRGGTITWYLNANDSQFQETLRRVRGEAQRLGDDVDRSFKRGLGGAGTATDNFNRKATTTQSVLREVGSQARIASSAFREFDNGIRNTQIDSVRSQTDATTRSVQSLNNSFRDNSGHNAARRNNNTTRLSIDDLRNSMGQSANMFRSFQISLRGFQMTSLIIGATIAGGAILELGAALVSLSGLLIAVPAAAGVAGSALAAIAVATGGVADAFKESIKPTKGATVAQTLARRQADLTATALKRDADLVRRLTDLSEDYSDTVQELANERLRLLNEQILEGVEAWESAANAANNYLNISERLDDLQLSVAEAQAKVNLALFEYGEGSQQALEASRQLYAAQGDLAQSNADLDAEFATISGDIGDLARNLGSLQAANKNQIAATLSNLRAMRLDKQIRGESTDEIVKMISVLEGLAEIKDTKLTANPDLAGAQTELDRLKDTYPEIARTASDAASDTEQSLTKSLGNISESMEDVRRERAELQSELATSMSDAAEASALGATGTDPFEGLSKNAASFVQALKDIHTAFQPVKDVIQDKFFAGLDTEIRNVATVAFPILETGLGNIATSMNGVIKEASRIVQQPFFTGAIESSMSTTAQAIDILKGALEPLARIVTDMMKIGEPFIIQLSEWAVAQAELGAAFTGSEEGQQKMTNGLTLAKEALKDLMDLADSVGGLFLDIFKVAQSADSNMLETLTKIVDKMREWVQSEEGMKTLQGVFEAAAEITENLAGSAGDILKLILDVVEGFNNLEEPSKSVVSDMIVWSTLLSPILTYVGGVAASMSAIFQTGREIWQVGAFGLGALGKGLDAAKTGFESFKLGMDGALIATEGADGVFGKLGNAVGTTRDAFSNGIQHVKDFGSTVADISKKGATRAAEIAAQGATAVKGWIVDSAKVVAGWITSFATLVARAATTAARMVVSAAVAAGAWIAGAVATTAAWVVANAAMLGIWGLAIAAIVGAVVLIVRNWDTITAFFSGIWQGIQDMIQGLINWVTENWPLLLAILTGPIGLAVLAIYENWETIKGYFSGAWEFIKRIWGGVAYWFAGIVYSVQEKFNGLKNGIESAFNRAIEWVRGVPGSIIGVFSGIATTLRDSGWSMIMGLWNGISSAFGRVQQWTADRLRSLRNLFPFSPAKEGPFSGSGYTSNSGQALMEDFGKGIESMGSKVYNATESIVEDVAGVFNGLTTDIGSMQTDFGISANAAMSAQVSELAPSIMDNSGRPTALSGTGSTVTINQNNQINTEVDMDLVNRNLAWELNKL